MKWMHVSAIACLFAASAATSVAEDKQTVLSTMEGQVMVNQGQSYVAATEGMFLYPGDRVMVMQGGSAQVQFANGCLTEIGTNEINTIDGGESCVTYAEAGTNNQAGSGGTGGGGGTGTGNAIGIGMAVIVTGGLVYEIADDDDDDPDDISP